MKYVVNSTWKHLEPCDWSEMQEWLEKVIAEPPPGCLVQRYEIEESNHGSVTIFPSKEVFESHREKRDALREESKDDGIVMTFQKAGLIRAEVNS